MTSDMKFFGSVTLGERGQVVIPCEAREALNILPGDKLLVFKAPIREALIIVKPEAFERHVQQMSKQAAELKEQLKKDVGE